MMCKDGVATSDRYDCDNVIVSIGRLFGRREQCLGTELTPPERRIPHGLAKSVIRTSHFDVRSTPGRV